MRLIERWHRSSKRRGILGTLLHIPAAATRPLFIAARKRRTRWRIRDWIRSHDRPLKVHIACGHDKKEGWLNTDLYFSQWCMDALEKLPFPTDSIDYVYCQHFVEHLRRDQVCFFFQECRRILRQEGVFRISTPDLAQVVRHYSGQTEEVSRRVIAWVAHTEFGGQQITAGQYLNAALRLHDHLHLFDFEDLRAALQSAGFSEVCRVPYGDSEERELRGLETRYLRPNNDWLQPLDLVVEARGTQ